MRQYYNAIFCQVYIGLYRVCSCTYSPLKGSHRVLRVLGLEASMGNGLRELSPILKLLCSSPGG